MTNKKILDEKIELSNSKIEETKHFIADCEYLINTANPSFHKITSARYQKEYLYYTQKIGELQTRYEKTLINFERDQKLYKKGVIAKIEFENSDFEHQLSINTLNQYRKQQKNTWQSMLTDYSVEMRELKSSVSQITQNQKEYMITAPIDGILKSVKGIEPGSMIISGAKIAEISPDTGLIVECYLSPSDIGLVSKEKKVSFQVDAFNYNQWGLATGEILEISKDIDMVNDQAVFKVRCAIDQEHLELKNGFKGNFNKGMTLSARFQLTERTLFDLLYDQVDDWLNPSSPSNPTIAQIQQ